CEGDCVELGFCRVSSRCSADQQNYNHPENSSEHGPNSNTAASFVAIVSNRSPTTESWGAKQSNSYSTFAATSTTPTSNLHNNNEIGTTGYSLCTFFNTTLAENPITKISFISSTVSKITSAFSQTTVLVITSSDDKSGIGGCFRQNFNRSSFWPQHS